ncbi:MAG: PIG-L deacetylase family protein [Bdellovibrionales bacterium]
MPAIFQFKLLIKKALTSFCRDRFLRTARDLSDTLPEGPLLVIAPHPDDETLGCGGLIRRYRDKGHLVRIVVVTDGGEVHLPQIPKGQDIASLRRKESLNATAALGVESHDVVFLGHPDGATGKHLAQIEDDLASQYWLTPPGLVLSPCLIDLHADHRHIATIVRKLVAAGKISCPVLEYPLWFWPKGAFRHLFSHKLLETHRKVDIRPYLAAKQTAIDAYIHQKNDPNWKQLEAMGLAKDMPDYELFFAVAP